MSRKRDLKKRQRDLKKRQRDLKKKKPKNKGNSSRGQVELESKGHQELAVYEVVNTKTGQRYSMTEEQNSAWKKMRGVDRARAGIGRLGAAGWMLGLAFNAIALSQRALGDPLYSKISMPINDFLNAVGSPISFEDFRTKWTTAAGAVCIHHFGLLMMDNQSSAVLGEEKSFRLGSLFRQHAQEKVAAATVLGLTFVEFVQSHYPGRSGLDIPDTVSIASVVTLGYLLDKRRTRDLPESAGNVAKVNTPKSGF